MLLMDMNSLNLDNGTPRKKKRFEIFVVLEWFLFSSECEFASEQTDEERIRCINDGSDCGFDYDKVNDGDDKSRFKFKN